jgi:acetoacetyl-CoA synthetase
LEAFDDEGKPVIGSLGEMVISKPMPSMPVFFWNDPEFKRYEESYFSVYPGIWRHGDFVKLTAEGGLTIYGRSDATLNRQGVRMGTAEIYRALNTVDEIADSLIVHIDNDSQDYMPLFLVLKTGIVLDEKLEKQIKTTLRKKCSPRHVPDKLIVVPEIPYTISGKKMEAPVKKILSGMSADKVLNKDAMRNPEAMNYFVQLSGDTP